VRIEILKQFSIFMPNRPGVLAAMTKLFANQGVNLIGIASEISNDSGLVRVAVPEGTDVSGILTQAGFASIETSLISIEIADKPGELAQITKALADNHINITTIYGTALGGDRTRILIAAENTPKAKSILESIGI
jgi:hypothetical protein